MELIWLDDFAAAWRRRLEQGRAPHALMLQGPPGAGKRATAAWIARLRLDPRCADSMPHWPWSWPEHADFHKLSPAEDRQTIGVEQVRDLAAALALTSYEGHGKVAIVDPANAMTDNAANSLLKTLEEPPGDALLVLIVDRVGRLPATIFSRCQRVSVVPPDTRRSLAWLEASGQDGDWPAALALAGGAPLAALSMREQVDVAASMARELAEVAEGRSSPLEIAAGWSRLEPGFVLDWLAREVQEHIRRACGGRRAAPAGAPGDSVLRRIDRRNLFCYLDIINGLRGQAPGSFNFALTLESLLIDWSEGLRTSRNRFAPGELLPVTDTG